MNRKTRHPKFKAISTTRRHIYFYALLVLGTVTVHNHWKGLQSPPVPPEVTQAYEVVAKANQMP